MKKALLIIPVIVVLACSGGDSFTDPNTPLQLELTLSPSVDTLFVGAPDGAGSTVQLDATATSQGSAIPVPSGRVFESQDPKVATVDASGKVTAVAPGTADITVRVNGVRAHATVVVLGIVNSVTVTAPAGQWLAGDTISLTATAFDIRGQAVPGQPFTYTSSSPIATVSPVGRVIFTGPGTATITATSGSASGTVQLTALAREFIGGAQATISTGMDATCGLLPLGRTYCFGRAPLIGIAKDTSCFDDRGPVAACTLVPLPIAAKLQLSAVTVGDSVACGLDAQGHAYCWGDDTYGEIGNGRSGAGTSTLPTAVVGATPGATTFTTISAGATHVCALTTSGAAYCWGRDTTFELGGADSIALSSSTPIPVGGGMTFKAIASGRRHTCALRASDGVAVCWGDNSLGQLGRGSVGAPSDVPTAIAGFAFTQIATKGDFTCGLTTGGNIACWGANESTQTGQPPSVSVAAPALISAGSGYVAVTAGWNHACALQSGGAAVCWGLNDYGQLGTGNLSAAPTAPSTVVGGHAFTAISAGRRTTCAVAADGAYCWGSNVLGAMGNQLQALATPTPTKTAVPQ